MTHVVDGGLLGRADEVQLLSHLVGRARNGQGRSVLLLGDPGIGKTALLDAATATAAAVRVLRIDGFEAESTIPYAGVQRLAIPLRDHLTELPVRQQDALRVAAGVAEGDAPDRFLVGLGVLGLLASAAAVSPVVCVVDDAHLLDQESLEVLAFVARRIEVESVAVLFAARDEREVTTRLSGVRDLPVAGLDTAAAVRLLARSAPAVVDPAAAAQIARETGGNPLALIDLAHELSSRDLGDLALRDEPIPVGPRLEAHYVRQVRQADPLVQDWVLLAATDSTGQVDLVRAAAQVLSIDDDVGDRAELAGLVELGDTVRFRHPLVRSAVYNAATGTDRRRAHGALATAADRLGLVELEAWHASRATWATDPAVADRLEHTADLAAARGGLASRASVLVRAAELSPPGSVRVGRLVAAAEAALAVGAAQTAQAHLNLADDDVADPVLRGRIILVRCALAMFMVDATLPTSAARLVEAADLFHTLDPVREQQALLRAYESYIVADRLSVGITQQQLGHRLLAGAAVADGPSATILRGMGALMLLSYEEAVPVARAAFEEIRRLPDHQRITMAPAIGSMGMFLWDEAGRRETLVGAAAAARAAGALQYLDALLWVDSLAELWGGEVRHAAERVDQVREVRRVMGYDAENVINSAVMAWTAYPREVVHAIGEGACTVGFGGVGTATQAALATRDLAEGRYADAFDRLRPLVDDPFLHVGASYFPDFVEAAVRSDHHDAARDKVEQLEALAAVNESGWCLGLALRSRALVAPAAEAEVCFKSAVAALDGTGALVELGRTHLLYGEWLRRMRRRADASVQLGFARDTLLRSGAEMFLPRAQAELEATGVDVDASPSTTHELTNQELTIARLAGAGHTNAEIGGLLFISTNTVDYHLRKVFQKLAISSRRQLTDRLGL